jgi:carotenoid cleavage dioxygenase-like enzyme
VDERLKGLPISAHSKVDERTGEFIFFAYGKKAPYMHYGVMDRHGKLQTFMPVELPGPRLPHDMAITPNYTILHDLPLFYDKDAFAAGATS